MKYKVGDKVRIQSLEWHQKEIESEKWCPNTFDTYWCSREMTISKIEKSHYLMEEDEQEFWWIDEMIEGLVEEEEIEFTEEDKYWCDIMSELDPTTYVLPEGYIFKDENGNVINATKIVLEKKKKEYPKTYEECSIINGCDNRIPLKIIGEFTKLINARNAYWRLAGIEMGLSKPWEPDWTSGKPFYCISVNGNIINKGKWYIDNKILAFPTEEMRDAFYENFKELIETVKEFL